MRNESTRIRREFPVCIIGAGLAGSEAAYQLARRGIDVALVEMRPKKGTPAHRTGRAAELVCSNSFRNNHIESAIGLLKEEMRQLDSLILQAAKKAQVPAGVALAVDREVFSQQVTKKLKGFSSIIWIEDEVVAISREDSFLVVHLESGQKIICERVLIASGPLTSDPLAEWILNTTGKSFLYFYDSIAPIVDAESIDMNKAFKASRYGRGDDDSGDYINCPMTKEQYLRFIEEIEKAQLVELHDFDKAQYFEGCLPIEEMVRRGKQTLTFGPMKPVGLANPHNRSERPFAVVQLRQDNLHASLYNMVGFQTRMKWPEQKRIFKTIPGLENAEFVRLGSMHRNTYICSPMLLNETMELKSFPCVHFAGQITGCEGYVESAAVGLFVGMTLVPLLSHQKGLSTPPPTTALGALLNHLNHADSNHFQPMNINFGLFSPLEIRCPKKEKKAHYVKRALGDLTRWQNKVLQPKIKVA